MRERALVHVAGPKGAGKTKFIERILDGADEWLLAARCVRDDSLRESRETAPKAHPELRRYREAGAAGAALFAFPESDIGSDAFFVTQLMEDYSQAVLLEGDKPLELIWRDDERGGALTKDEPVVVHCYTTPADIQDGHNLAELGRFCRKMGREARQAEIGLVVGDEYFAIRDYREE